MNFIAVCLHCLDMRDFHSHMRDTPFLNALRKKSIFIPMGRGQGHHQGDSLNAELTGVWTARCCDSRLTPDGYSAPRNFGFPRTILERMKESGYQVFPFLRNSFAVEGGIKVAWLRDDPSRLRQFDQPAEIDINPDAVTKALRRFEWLGENASRLIKGMEAFGYRDYIIHRWMVKKWCRLLKRCRKNFYAHYIINRTHRPWGHPEKLCQIMGEPDCSRDVEGIVRLARRAALEHPDQFAALRRAGLAEADSLVKTIFEETSGIKDTVYLVYSNHGEVYDHFRYHYGYENQNGYVIGTSHGNFPYEVLYANMQMWVIPGFAPHVMTGIGRSIDIAPTILDLAGIKASDLDGESMLKYFNSDSFPARDRYAESWMGEGCLSMARSDGYKLISTGITSPSWSPFSNALKGPDYHKLAVFYLPSDPYEYVNLLETPEGQSVLSWAVEKHASLSKIDSVRLSAGSL